MDKNGIVAERIIRRQAVIIGIGNAGLGFHLSVAVAAIERAGEFVCGEIIIPVSHGQHVLGVNFVVAEMQARVVAIAGGNKNEIRIKTKSCFIMNSINRVRIKKPCR